jgi:hypothetical protein
MKCIHVDISTNGLHLDNMNSYLVNGRAHAQLIKQKMAVCPCLVKDQINQDDLQVPRLESYPTQKKMCS